MKLNRLKSVVNQAIRSSGGYKGNYMIDPFYHYTPEVEIVVDLITGKLTPDMKGDDVEKYYTGIFEWFHEVLPKEGIPLDVIDEAFIKITPEGKTCIIRAKGREFKSFIHYK